MTPSNSPGYWRTNDSLPLMGIGDLTPLASHGFQHTISLPLMGIGDSTNRPRVTPTIWHSLPLMGIGDLRLRRRPRPGRVGGHLTTPHGDRGSWRRHRFTAAWRDSLPLMGIGDHVICSACLRSGASAHYPSWGSGMRWAPRSRPPAPRSHYPSWGSGILSFRRSDGSCAGLWIRARNPLASKWLRYEGIVRLAPGGRRVFRSGARFVHQTSDQFLPCQESGC